MLKKIYQELILIRKELQEINDNLNPEKKAEKNKIVNAIEKRLKG